MAADTEKELQQLKKRLRELAEKCYMQNVYCFTGFLGIAELSAFYEMQGTVSHVPFTVYGGNESCERRMIRFGSAELLGYEEAFPIVCLQISPLSEKFAEDLTHRDFLGACLHLGIARSAIGDILVRGKCAYLYCTEAIAPYMTEHLIRVRHTDVSVSPFQGQAENLAPKLEERTYQTASERLDAVIARVCILSREKSLLLFRSGKVFVNGRQQENNSALLKAGDVVSVRGYGKFIYHGVTHTTRKGKHGIRVEIYV